MQLHQTSDIVMVRGKPVCAKCRNFHCGHTPPQNILCRINSGKKNCNFKTKQFWKILETVTAPKKIENPKLKLLTCQRSPKEIKDESYLTLFSKLRNRSLTGITKHYMNKQGLRTTTLKMKKEPSICPSCVN